MKIAWIAALVLLAPSGARIASADSDGYYCIGPGYLAYQFGFAPPPPGSHRLHVVRVGGAAGIHAPVVFDLPQFQVHGMRCDARTVRLAAFDAVYTVRLDEANRPVGYSKVPFPATGRLPEKFVGPSPNLGGWSRVRSTLGTERVPLGSTRDGGQAHLVIRGTNDPSARCWSIVTTHVVRTDRNGRDVQQLEIFRGRGPRECGERPRPEGASDGRPGVAPPP